MKRIQPMSLTPPLHKCDCAIEEYSTGAKCPKAGQITNLTELVWAVEGKLALVCPKSWSWRKPHPAAVIINLSGHVINQLINDGLFVYEKP